MQVKDPDILRLIERISEHYKTNISNRFIRPALLVLPLDTQSWEQIENLTEKAEQYRYQGFHLDELYQQISAAARFVAFARRELAPALRTRMAISRGAPGDNDRVLRDMAINALPSNLTVFADLINELYVKLVEIDKESSKGQTPLYLQMPELHEIGTLLIGSGV